jgi:hypothetical protein
MAMTRALHKGTITGNATSVNRDFLNVSSEWRDATTRTGIAPVRALQAQAGATQRVDAYTCTR